MPGLYSILGQTGVSSINQSEKEVSDVPSVSLFGSAASVNVVIAFVFALILLYLVLRLLLTPFHKAGRLLLRLGVTTAALVVINLVGGRFGYGVPLNLITVLLPASLGVPGLFLVALMQFLLF